MPTPLKFQPTSSERKPKRKPYSLMPVETEAKVRELIDAGTKHSHIAKQLRIHKSSVHRVAQRMKLGTTIDRPRSPTKCSRRPDCDCVTCGANREVEKRLAARREAIKQGQGV